MVIIAAKPGLPVLIRTGTPLEILGRKEFRKRADLVTLCWQLEPCRLKLIQSSVLFLN